MARHFAMASTLMILAGWASAADVDTKALADKAMEAERLGKQQEAVAIYKSLAEQGDTRAMIALGLKYHQGDGVAQDYKQAMNWYLQAYEKNDGDAFNNIGVMYRDGLGVETNKQIAYLLFLATHMNGLGTEATQYRAGSNLSRVSEDIGENGTKAALCWTWAYVDQYVKSRGTKKEVTPEVLPSKDMPSPHISYSFDKS